MARPIRERARGCNGAGAAESGAVVGFALGRCYIGSMAAGRINSPASIETAADVFSAFGGSWQAVERIAQVRADGVRVIRRSDIERARRQQADPQR